MSRDVLREWVKVLSKEYAASLRHEEGEFRLESSSDKWRELTGSTKTIVISSEPESGGSWWMRLRLVEKAAARAIISAPVGFSCSLGVGRKQRKSKAGHTDVMRLAFGFSLSLGASSRQRYTAYYVKLFDKAFHILGEDQLFDHCCEIDPLDLRSPCLKDGLKPLLPAVDRAQADYRASSMVTDQLDSLREKLLKELTDLDKLYAVNYGQYAQLLGRPPDGLRGEDAIEAEYVSRMEDIFLKYQPAVVFEPLTLGVIRCEIRKRKRGKITSIAFPFFKDRWQSIR